MNKTKERFPRSIFPSQVSREPPARLVSHTQVTTHPQAVKGPGFLSYFQQIHGSQGQAFGTGGRLPPGGNRDRGPFPAERQNTARLSQSRIHRVNPAQRSGKGRSSPARLGHRRFIN